MARYMPHINAENRETFQEEWEEHQTYLEFARLEGVRKMAKQQKEMDSLKTRIAEQQTEDEALGESLILTPQYTPRAFAPSRSFPHPRASLLPLSQISFNLRAAPFLLSCRSTLPLLDRPSPTPRVFSPLRLSMELPHLEQNDR
jgi:hypothetical protein